jgi:hypothetical protein
MTEDFAARAMQLLRGLFPGLKNVDVVVTYRCPLDERNPLHNRNSVAISLYKPHHPASGDLSTQSEYLFDAHFQFIPKNRRLPYLKNGQLKDLTNLGPFIQDRLDRLKKEVNAHPEWSDAQVVAALKAAGAKSGPDDRPEFLRALPLKALEPVTGPLEVVSARFGVRFDPVAEDEPREADLTWSVETRWHSQDGRYEGNYRLTFRTF